MKKVILVLIAFVFVMTGCGTTGNTNGGADTSEISAIINEHLDISPYIPETDYKLGAVILESLPGMEDEGPFYATVNYYDPLDELTKPTEEMVEQFDEMFPDREVVYGTLYVEASVISIEIYPAGRYEGMGDDVETIEVAGHEVQYQFLEEGTDGRDADNIFMVLHFDDVSYSIRYSVQSNNIEKDAKKLAEDIIKNNL